MLMLNVDRRASATFTTFPKQELLLQNMSVAIVFATYYALYKSSETRLHNILLTWLTFDGCCTDDDICQFKLSAAVNHVYSHNVPANILKHQSNYERTPKHVND